MEMVVANSFWDATLAKGVPPSEQGPQGFRFRESGVRWKGSGRNHRAPVGFLWHYRVLRRAYQAFYGDDWIFGGRCASEFLGCVAW